MSVELPIERREKLRLNSMFLDLNSYFASVEQAEDPNLRGRPVGVCPVMADSSFIIAASYEAKRFGVKTGTQIGEAKRLCPEIQLIGARPSVYVHYHNLVLEAVESVLPIEKVCSIDEMSFRLLGSECEPDETVRLAHRLKQAIFDGVSPSMMCSVGIAPNRFLAKLATDMEKPNGLVQILPQDLPERLFGLRLTEFAGINRRMEARLNAAGLFTSDDLVTASRETLLRAFGSIVGERWYYMLKGFDVTNPEHGRKSLGHSHVLPPDKRTDQGTREVLLRLVHKACARMRSNSLVAGTLVVFVSGHKKSWECRRKVSPTADTVAVTHHVVEMWESRDFSSPRTVGITFSDLRDGQHFTPSLFEDEPDRTEMCQAVDKLNQRFGKNSVYLASIDGAKDMASEKIAFNKTWLFSEGRGDNFWTRADSAAETMPELE